MRNFKITVNGIEYDVAVEEIESGAAVQSATAQIAPAQSATAPARQAAVPKPAPVPVIKPQSAPEGFRLEAPMPGKIADIRVEVGNRVKKGDPGVILEAMKMENEIFLPVGGKVISVNVSKGSTVKTGDLLLVIEQEV